MNSELLEYFHRELDFLRNEGPRFAQQYPNIGPLLNSPPGESADPHVERLIQAFAWLNARVQLHLDRDLLQVTDALYSVVFPHAQVPFPSCAVVEFAPPNPQEILGDGMLLPRGTLLESELWRGRRCQFHTSSPVLLRPFALKNVQFRRIKDHTPARSVLQLSLQSLAPGRGIEFGPSPLRIFLGAPPAAAFALYEILVSHCIRAVVEDQEGQQLELPRRELVTGAGFQANESLQPHQARVPAGHRLIQEFFAFPEKHLFVDIHGLEHLNGASLGETVRLDLYFDKTHSELENLTLRDSLRLHCTPIINLFPMRTEPISLTHEVAEYPVRIDVRFPESYEVFSIDRVSAVSADRTIRIPEFYEPRRESESRACDAAWLSRRRDAGAPHSPSQMWIGLADPDGQFLAADEWSLDIEATCMNADVPASLPYDGRGPRLTTPDEPMMGVECIVPPTRRARPPLQERGHGRLVTMLALQSLPLGNEVSDIAPRLREYLRMWSPVEVRKGMTNIDCLLTADARQVLEEIWVGSDRCVARGVEVTAELDESLSPGGSVFLMCSVLEQFLSMTSAMNCFTRFVVRSSETNRTIHRFPARAGDQTLATLT